MKAQIKGHEKLNRVVAGYYTRANNLTVPGKRFVAHMTQSGIPRQFRAGGEPKWTPSIRVRLQGGKTLIGRTRRLMKTWSGRALRDRAILGTNVLYAAVHLKKRAGDFVIRARRAPWLTFFIPGLGWRRKKEVRIPYRGIGFGRKDIAVAKSMYLGYIGGK